MSKAAELMKMECNRYVNGRCTTRRCVVRAMERSGLRFPLTDPDVATCEHHEAVQEIERARDLVRRLVDNEPDADAADAVSVYDVWRKDAVEFLERTE